MSDLPPSEPSFPALLRSARLTYRRAILDALNQAGFDDLPRQGSFVIGAIARSGLPLGEIIRQLGASKQVAGQLVDILVARGYLERATDPEDRRRLTISLTERGHSAAATMRQTVERIDAEIAQRLPPTFIEHTRATLAVIGEIGAG